MTAVNLAPQYDPSSIESTIYQKWLEADVFTARADESKEPFVIVIPPPNVTGVLHMGHGLNNTVQDVLIRFQRMRGRDALWLPGTDHAGIATQNVVERLLADEGKKKEDLGREKFVERVWQHVNETGGTILDQLKAIGCSCDWSRTRFTFDEGLSRAVREVFVALYEKGLIYRGKYIINWCPRCRTALSNEEAEKKDTEGKLWHLRYPIVGDAGGDPTGIVVATTRPETMLGDTAVAVHPDDERYGSVVGKTVRLPLANRDIPIIADRGVDPEFGTGAVKVTPAHDPLDFEIALRHDLEALNILTDDALLNDNVPEPYRGMTVVAARTQVVEDLEAAGVMLDVAQHSHSVGRCYRCDTIVEPRLSDQWFVKMKPLAEPALQAYEQGRIGFVPQRMGDDFVRWLNEIRDWCISRQLWWGHRIPAWYCGDCDKIIVSREDPTECDSCGAGALTRDPDVLDTWFSSWLWPFSTFGWPERTDDLARYYPGTVLVTARDIIFFWVSRMIMAGLEFMGDVPFKTVVFNGVVRDAQHRKMSKSLGNGIDPLDVVRRFGADALRFTVIHAGAPGTDIPLDHEDLETTFSVGRNFANKVWNVGRFILSNLDGMPIDVADLDKTSLELADRWILSRTDGTIRDVTKQLEQSRFNDAAASVYRFLWNELADWYIEHAKPRLYGDTPGGDVARSVLYHGFSTTMKLLHPFMPFVTEELWDNLPGTPDGMVAAANWPEASGFEHSDAEKAFGVVQEFVGAVRNARAEYGVAPGTEVTVSFDPAADASRRACEAELTMIKRLAKTANVEFGKPPSGIGAHAVLSDGSSVFTALGDAIDVARECGRLRTELARLERLVEGVSQKLANEQFLSRAPAEVVEREREKERSWREQRSAVSDKLQVLGC